MVQQRKKKRLITVSDFKLGKIALSVNGAIEMNKMQIMCCDKLQTCENTLVTPENEAFNSWC